MADIRQSTAFIVDDEPVIASTLAAILIAYGIKATPFTNPITALREAEANCPDVLISDVMMPQLKGTDLAIRFQKLCTTCKVILFSGQAATSELLQDAVCDGHNFMLLEKPIHPKDLLAAIGVTVS